MYPTYGNKDPAFVVLLQSVACPAFLLFVFAILFCFVRAYEEFGSPGSSLSCDESVLYLESFFAITVKFGAKFCCNCFVRFFIVNDSRVSIQVG
jgi:hypothetical protein